MDYILIVVAAFLAAILALFSGFGLGTVLLPVFAVFFPVPIAVAATAVVHLLNNVFRGILVGRGADWRTVLIFSIPAGLFAVLGALLLSAVSSFPPLLTYHLGGGTFEITAVKLLIAALIAVFAAFEIAPVLEGIRLDRRYLPLGGALAGFFGGVSGQQGALRSAFLARAGLNRDAFVGTSAVTAIVIDGARLVIYGAAFLQASFVASLGAQGVRLIVAATLAALAGNLVAARLLPRVSLAAIRWLVGIMLIAVALALTAGLI